jgi:hypothetical protein
MPWSVRSPGGFVAVCPSSSPEGVNHEHCQEQSGNRGAAPRRIGRLAFRQGVRQSEADWRSLYEDLIALGVIEHDDCAD